MKTEVTVDQGGRILIPKAVRDQLHLHPGDVLNLETEGDDITIRTRRRAAGLVKKEGIWVYRTEEPLNFSIPDLIDQVREERHRRILGMENKSE